jgi:hypothetical protein
MNSFALNRDISLKIFLKRKKIKTENHHYVHISLKEADVE